MAVILVPKPLEFEIGLSQGRGRPRTRRTNAPSPARPVLRGRNSRGHRGAVRSLSRVRPRGPPVRRREIAFPLPRLSSHRRRLARRGRLLQLAEPARKPRSLLPHRGATLSVPDRDGLGYRLPTDAEWEYACRAGSRASRPHGSSEALLGNFAWYLPNADNRPHPVGHLKPNDFGLFDMLGNAFEWTEDRYTRYSDGGGHAAIAEGEKTGTSNGCVEVVLRGGSFSSPATLLRSAYRERSSPSDPARDLRFPLREDVTIGSREQGQIARSHATHSVSLLVRFKVAPPVLPIGLGCTRFICR